MKWKPLLCWIAVLVAGCHDTTAPAGFLKREALIGRHFAEIEAICREFKLLSISKLSWSETGFITLVDSGGRIWEGSNVSELTRQKNGGSSDKGAEALERLIKRADVLGINGFEESMARYVEFKDGFVLMIDEDKALEDGRGVELGKRVLEVRPGWYISLDD
jgi:hypothetical protein